MAAPPLQAQPIFYCLDKWLLCSCLWSTSVNLTNIFQLPLIRMFKYFLLAGSLNGVDGIVLNNRVSITYCIRASPPVVHVGLVCLNIILFSYICTECF